MEKDIKKQNLSEIAIKNSVYSLSSIFVSKVGGLIFTIIIARILLPELFGIYSLALSITAIAITFTDLGIGSAAIRYISDALGKEKKGKARTYFKYLFKIKVLLILLAIVVVFVIAHFLSYNIFDKPLLFFPLMLSCLYVLMESLRALFGNLFTATKNLRPTPFLELIYQISKISLSLFAVMLLSTQFKVAGVFVAFGISGFLFLIASLIILIKKDRELFFGGMEKIEKPRVWKYIKFMGLASLSLVFFTSIDTLMLGIFVDASYLGYYRAALSLIITIASLLSISGVLLPIFTQIHKDRLKRGFQKTLRYILMFAVPIFFGLIFLSNYLITAIYGSEYLAAAKPLYFLSLLILVVPLVALYSTLFAARENPKDLSRFILISLIINIILNYVLIKSLLGISQEYAIIGSSIATLLSQVFLLVSLAVKAKSKFKISLKDSSFFKFLISSLGMSIFLVIFNHFTDINLFSGIIEIIVGAIIYFGILLLIKGVREEDWRLIKDLKPQNFLKD
jgi:stage V sporulation protein B